MANLTNSGLVAHCKKALTLKTKYMWGGLFREITTTYISQLFGIYGAKQYSTSRLNVLKALIGKDYYGCDCIGLVKSYYFGGIGLKANAPGWKSSLDYNVETMYNAAKTKGKIATFPKTPGLLVMNAAKTHVGVYIGDDYVVECTLGSRGDGVVKTKFSAGGWGLWCQCPVIDDDTTVKTTTTTPSNTTTGSSAALAVGDIVTIIAPYAGGAFVASAKNTKAIGSRRYITKIYAGAKFPYQLGVKKSDRTTANTTGFAAASALKK